jgi:putative hemin transport protein
MTTIQRRSPEEIRDLRARNPEMRERDFARIHKISEAELVAAHIGHGVTRLRVDVPAALNGLAACGEVMALTRNDSAVHEKIGPYENVNLGAHAGTVLGKQIDLRVFPNRWAFAFAVEKRTEEGGTRRSLQFFDSEGTAIHKVHTREATDRHAWDLLVASLLSDDQSPLLDLSPVTDPGAVDTSAAASQEELRQSWSKLTDTHQFFGMLKRLNLSRHQALHMIDADYAWPLDLSATRMLLNGAAGTDLPIMVFIGNHACIQIHSGPIVKVGEMGPWINIFDETFHMHLRLDHIAEAWAVRKPTSDGHVTSVECYGADKQLIVQFFGKRQEGRDERPQWRELVESLPRLEQSSAA